MSALEKARARMKAKKEKDIKISPAIVKENLVFFINAIIENPSFSSQTKDTLTTKVNK